MALTAFHGFPQHNDALHFSARVRGGGHCRRNAGETVAATATAASAAGCSATVCSAAVCSGGTAAVDGGAGRFTDVVVQGFLVGVKVDALGA